MLVERARATDVVEALARIAERLRPEQDLDRRHVALLVEEAQALREPTLRDRDAGVGAPGVPPGGSALGAKPALLPLERGRPRARAAEPRLERVDRQQGRVGL